MHFARIAVLSLILGLIGPTSASLLLHGALGSGGTVGSGAEGDLAYYPSPGTTVKGTSPGVFNVRLIYGAVPDGNTDNATAISNAFTASNAVTKGTPTVYFDCDTDVPSCQYNYSGSSTSPINPTIPTTIACAPGVTLDYTGSAHAADIGPTNLSGDTQALYTIQGCRWTGGASYTQGIYINTYVTATLIQNNLFYNFGNTTGYTIEYPSASNTWQPSVINNTWMDRDGNSRNILDAHAAVNSDLMFIGNKFVCTTNTGGACSVSSQGVGLWIFTGIIRDNVLSWHYPAVRLSSCQTCGGGEGSFIEGNIFEANTNAPTPMITFGDPGGAGNINVSGAFIANNSAYWPAANGVTLIGPETPSSGSFSLYGATIANNVVGPAPSAAEFFYIDSPLAYVYGNKSGNVLITQSTSPPLLDAYSYQNALWGIPGALFSASGISLPSCSSGNKGQQGTVSDATAPTFMGTYVSGGTVTSPVICNGTNWLTY